MVPLEVSPAGNLSARKFPSTMDSGRSGVERRTLAQLHRSLRLIELFEGLE